MHLFLRSLRPVQLRLVAAIARHGKLRLAADHCAMTVPAASRMLAEMEDRLGGQLFERVPRGMVATPIGKVLAIHARKLVSDIDQMADDFVAHHSGTGGTVRVGAVTGAALAVVIPAILDLKRDAPLAQVSLDVSSSSRLMWGLERGHYDFAICRPGPEAHLMDFDIVPARKEAAYLMVRRAHPLSGATPATFASMADYTWTLQDRGAPIRRAFEQAFNNEGTPPPRNLIETASVVAIMALVRDSDVIAVITQEVADLLMHPPYCADLSILHPPQPVFIEAYDVLCPRTRILSGTAGRLLDLVRTRLDPHAQLPMMET